MVRKSAIELTLSMAGMMCLWTGLMKIAECGGITNLLSCLFFSNLKTIVSEYDRDSMPMKCICMNITANLLGMGNAATPLGIGAMKEMDRASAILEFPSNSMVMFVVLNTASVQPDSGDFRNASERIRCPKTHLTSCLLFDCFYHYGLCGCFTAKPLQGGKEREVLDGWSGLVFSPCRFVYA